MSDEETDEAKATRRREEDFYDWVEGKDQDSDYNNKKEEMRDIADRLEYANRDISHLERYESNKEYEQRRLRDLRGRDY